MRNLKILLIAIFALSVGCNQPSLTPSKGSGNLSVTLGEGSATIDGLSVTNGNVIKKNGEPGLAFAFVAAPDRTKELTYFLVFDHSSPEGGVKTESGGAGLEASGSHTISAFGNQCTAEYSIRLDPETHSINSESIVVGGHSFSREQGPIFLVDMKSNPPSVTQRDFELPATIPELTTPNAAEGFGERILRELRKTDQRVDDFCRQIED